MLIAFISSAVLLSRQDPAPRFDFFGSMSSLVVSGAHVAPVSSGIPFQIVLTEQGAKISSTDFGLKPKGSDKSFHLSFPGLAFQGGRLAGKAEILNQTGTSLQGMRLDFVNAVETYQAKDAQGNSVQKTRVEEATFGSPLSFGDMGDGASNGQLAIDVGGISFKPETVSVLISGVVSGVRFARSIQLDSIGSNGQIEVDKSGKLYISNVTGNCVNRVDSDGQSVVALCNMPDQCKGMALNPATGELVANCGNHPTIFYFTPDGKDAGQLADGVLHGWAGYERYDKKGRMWSTAGQAYVMFDASHNPTTTVDKFGASDAEAGRFDFGADGALYATGAAAVYVRHPDGTGGVFASGTGDKLGQLFGVSSVRVGPDGLVYVAETGANNIELCTITVYTPGGAVVRAFGRGAKSPMDGWPDNYWPSWSAPIW